MSISPEETRCPVCGEAYEERIVVEQGDRWGDLFPGTPFDYFQKYRRRCAAQADAERGTEVTGDERVVYFHGGRGRAVR